MFGSLSFLPQGLGAKPCYESVHMSCSDSLHYVQDHPWWDKMPVSVNGVGQAVSASHKTMGRDGTDKIIID